MSHPFTYDLYGAGVPVFRLIGLAGFPELWVTLDADGAVRTLWPVRGLPARLPERPIEPGLPSLASILRGALAAEDASC